MSKALKIILGIFGFFAVLVIAAVIIIPLVVDPNDYREHIARAVEEETGRSFEIEGEISLSVFPWLGLEVGRMRLGNPPDFDGEPFVEIGSAAVGARLVPLLRRRLEVSTLRLDGLRVRLVQAADGRNNWAGLGGEPAEAAPREPDGAAFRLERVAGLRITDALLSFDDRQAGRVVAAAVPRLTTGEIAPGRAFSVEAEASVALEDDSRLELDLSGRTRFLLEGPAVDVDDFRLDFRVSGAEIPAGTQAGRLRAPKIGLDLGAETLSLPELALEFAGLRIAAEVEGREVIDAPAFSGRLEVAEFSPRALLQNLGETPPETADGAVLGKASFATRFNASPDSLSLESLRLVLDDTTATGSASIGFGEPTRIRSELQVDAIDLDRYLPPEPDTPVEPEPAEDVELAFDWLRGLDLDSSLRIGQLVVNGLRLSALEARAVARDGVLTVQPIGAELYGGSLRGTARLDARRSPATFTLEQSLASLELQPFIRDLSGFERLTGIARIDTRLSTTAASTAQLMSGLEGELAFEVSDGAFQGINLWFEMQRAYALARGRAAPARTSPDTEFRQLTGTAVIRDGVLVNRDLVGGLPFMVLEGRGEVDLAQGAMDYRLDAVVIREAIDEATGERSELAGARLPLRMRGPLDSPSVSVDVAGLLREGAAQEALRRLGVDEEDARSLEEDLKERVQDRVRGLRDRLRPNN